MTTYVDGLVEASVPATSANLGPGFDALGLALGLRDRLRARVLPEGLDVRVVGFGAEEIPRDETHLVVRAMRATFDLLGGQPPGLFVGCDNVIPHGRGLGSSSAAIVAGVGLARALVAGGELLLDDSALFQLAADLEGHPDNVAAALYGGFVISGRENDRWYAVQASVDPRVSVVAFVPDTAVHTHVARALLPASIGHDDAAANAGRAALLVAALGGQPEHLLPATRDFLHQDQRAVAMPASLDLVHRLRADGVPAVVSGAGPSVLAFCDGSSCGPATTDNLLDQCPAGWEPHHLRIERDGLRLE